MTPADLKAARLALGLSQKAIAQTLGLPPNTWARWERGELAIGKPTLLLLALESLTRRALEETRAAKRSIARAKTGPNMPQA